MSGMDTSNKIKIYKKAEIRRQVCLFHPKNSRRMVSNIRGHPVRCNVGLSIDVLDSEGRSCDGYSLDVLEQKVTTACNPRRLRADLANHGSGVFLEQDISGPQVMTGIPEALPCRPQLCSQHRNIIN